MQIVIPLLPGIVVLAYFLIGYLAARLWAISGEAFIVLIVAWPMFLVLALAAPVINWWVNRHIPERRNDDRTSSQ